MLVRKDLPGQLANRIFQAMIREATNLINEGVATPEDVDRAIKNGLGIRLPVWGVIEHIDAVGLDLCLGIQKTVLPALNNSPAPVQVFGDLVARGDLGSRAARDFTIGIPRASTSLCSCGTSSSFRLCISMPSTRDNR